MEYWSDGIQTNNLAYVTTNSDPGGRLSSIADEPLSEHGGRASPS